MKLLIVDDSTDIVEILSSTLEMFGHKVDTAYDGTEAVERLRNNRYDIVITDAKMPIMDGFKLCKFIKSHFSAIYVIGISGCLDALKELKEAGADICFSKPFKIEEVEETIENRFHPSLTAFSSAAVQLTT
ncbi:MAG TPA: response regulator [Syntrophales bacterium]|nr:response regulator [Syntrophales bacterium]